MLLGTSLLRFSFYGWGSPGKGQSSEQIRAGESILKMETLVSGDALGRRDTENASIPKELGDSI